MIKNNEILSVEMVSCTTSHTTIYQSNLSHIKKHKKNDNSAANLSDNDCKGIISKSAKKRLRASIGWLILKVAHKIKRGQLKQKVLAKNISFITLTLPSKQVHTDKEIKELCLNQFLIEMRKIWGLKDFVWRAETQKNGNIHFHLLTDKYIPYTDIRARWNRIVDKLGYVKRYTEKTGKTNPPSTEIKAIKKVQNIELYISKYCTKDEGNRPIKGRLWYASESLLNIQTPSTEIDSQLAALIKQFIKDSPDSVYYGERCVILRVSVFKSTVLDSDFIRAMRQSFIESQLFKKVATLFDNKQPELSSKSIVSVGQIDEQFAHMDFPF